MYNTYIFSHQEYNHYSKAESNNRGKQHKKYRIDVICRLIIVYRYLITEIILSILILLPLIFQLQQTLMSYPKYSDESFAKKPTQKLRPPLLLRPLVSVQKCIFLCKWVLLMRPDYYYDHYQQVHVPSVVLLSGIYCTRPLM